MRCFRCRADKHVGMKFCGQCGARLGSKCAACGAYNPAEHQFCGQCGASLDTLGFEESAEPQPYFPKPTAAASPRFSEQILPGEMKQVTVLFCDIVDSTPLTERLGPEAMRDLVASFLDTSLAEVRRYGGIAPQFSGDGFMALFGAPLAQEDHVQRALLAALAIQSTLGAAARPGASAGANWHSHRARCLRPSRRRSCNGIHGDRGYRQCRRSPAIGR